MIIVGIDGSEGSDRALRFAIHEASIRDIPLRAVTVWHVPSSMYAGGWVGTAIETDTLEQDARELAERQIARVGRFGGVDRELVVREGNAASVLIEEAKGADMLVVGSRGLGGFRGLLLGSVSQQCAHHAACPIVIVPGGEGG
jgi:nucleotide-binding universal stress UspA family protein